MRLSRFALLHLVQVYAIHALFVSRQVNRRRNTRGDTAAKRQLSHRPESVAKRRRTAKRALLSCAQALAEEYGVANMVRPNSPSLHARLRCRTDVSCAISQIVTYNTFKHTFDIEYHGKHVFGPSNEVLNGADRLLPTITKHIQAMLRRFIPGQVLFMCYMYA